MERNDGRTGDERKRTSRQAKKIRNRRIMAKQTEIAREKSKKIAGRNNWQGHREAGRTASVSEDPHDEMSRGFGLSASSLLLPSWSLPFVPANLPLQT